MAAYRLDVVTLAPQAFAPLLELGGDRASLFRWDCGDASAQPAGVRHRSSPQSG
jgi:hypothetical protein